MANITLVGVPQSITDNLPRQWRPLVNLEKIGSVFFLHVMVYLNEDGPFPSGYPSDQELETTDVLLSYNDEMEVTYDVQIETTMDRYFGSAEENGPNPPNLCTLWYFQLQIDNYNGEKPLYVRYKHLNNNDYVYPIGALVYPISNYNF